MSDIRSNRAAIYVWHAYSIYVSLTPFKCIVVIHNFMMVCISIHSMPPVCEHFIVQTNHFPFIMSLLPLRTTPKRFIIGRTSCHLFQTIHQPFPHLPIHNPSHTKRRHNSTYPSRSTDPPILLHNTPPISPSNTFPPII